MSNFTSVNIQGNANIDWYPQIYSAPLTTEDRSILRLSLMHVRAANDIEIEYNSERDGWVIFQHVKTVAEEWDEANNTWIDGVEERREMAFIPAWATDEVGV
jgi:hypothetical protein